MWCMLQLWSLCLQEYIALVVTHTSQTDQPGGFSPAPRRVTPVKQASAAPSAMAMQLGSPASSQKQAVGSKAEAQHAQQAVLNQLKEVPVKPVNAALLVEPLLDHGTVLCTPVLSDALLDVQYNLAMLLCMMFNIIWQY